MKNLKMNGFVQKLIKRQNWIFGLLFILLFGFSMSKNIGSYSNFFQNPDLWTMDNFVAYFLHLLLLPAGIFIIAKKRLGWLSFAFFLLFQFFWMIFYFVDYGILGTNIILKSIVLAVIIILLLYINTDKTRNYFSITHKNRLYSLILIGGFCLTVTYLSFNPLDINLSSSNKRSDESGLREKLKIINQGKADSIKKKRTHTNSGE